MTFTPHHATLTDEKIISACEPAGEWFTRKQIADKLGRKKTPSLIARIEKLCDECHLERGQDTMPNGITVFFYRLMFDPANPPF